MKRACDFLSLVILILISGPVVRAQVQSVPPPLVTDRPDQTEASRTVPGRTIQVETGFVSEKISEENRFTERLLFPTTLIRFSITENLEVRIIDQFNNTHITREGEEDEVLQGLENLAIGIKMNICDEEGWRPEMAFLTHLTLPVAGSDHRNDRILADLKILLSHSLSSRFDWGCNLGWEQEDESVYGNGIYSFEISYLIADKWSAYLETYGTAPEFDHLLMNIDGGISCMMADNFKIDFSGSRGVNLDTYYWSAGFSLRLPH